MAIFNLRLDFMVSAGSVQKKRSPIIHLQLFEVKPFHFFGFRVFLAIETMG